MTKLYTQNLNGKGAVLKKRLQGYDNVADPLSCKDELVLQQSTLEDHVEEYADALDSGDKSRKIAFGAIVNDRAKDIINTKATMARIEQMRQQTITRDTLTVWVRSIIERLYESFPDFPEQVTTLAEEIESSILGTSTTEVKESELFAEMVSTVPAIEVESNELQ